jgi:hypothetical protein
MTTLTCAAVRQRLAEFHDNELPIQERISVQGHLNACDGGTARLLQRRVRATPGRRPRSR